MKSLGRRAVALLSLLGAMAPSLCAPAVGSAQTYRTDVELTTKEAGKKEVTLGNLVADAIRAAAKSDVAIIAASSFNETTLPKGSFTAQDVLRAVDGKDDTIVLVKLTGDQLLRALEHGLYVYPISNSGFLQFSGMTVTFNPSAEKERRVVSVKIDGELLQPGKTYKVAMPAPLANGALAYFKIWKKSDIEKDTDKTLESAIIAYLNEHKTITKADERLVARGR
ncbi:MAG TPA: 5'-nucleotidase [Chthonomonadaceae bacterium]|nr:5'-nucleotidase [Chthonomonadaceae bacterium]